jgi:hypothetical protein
MKTVKVPGRSLLFRDVVFARFMKEVSERLQQSPVVRLKSFKLGSIILSGHSGGYQVISSILAGVASPAK